MVNDFHPAILYFDWKFEEPAFKPFRYRIAAYYYNQAEKWGKPAVLNYKNDAFPKGAAVFEVERGRFNHVRRPHWQTGTSVATNTWGYTKNAHYRTSNSVVDELVDIVSKNGNLLLNVDPKSNGVIPIQAKKILMNVGKWLKANGQAIYNTHPWKVFGEGPTHLKKSGSFAGNLQYTGKDIRFTEKGKILYATALAWPGKEMVIHSLAASKGLNHKPIKSVMMLANHQMLKFHMEQDGLHVQMPAHPVGHYAYSIEIRFK